jgi:hypothetical protein
MPSAPPLTVGGELVPIVGGCSRYRTKLSFKVRNGIGQDGWMAAPLDREAQGSIQLR